MLLPEVHEVLHMLLPEVHEIEVIHMLLPLMCEDIFWRSSSFQRCLPLKVIFHRILFSNCGSLPLDVAHHGFLSGQTQAGTEICQAQVELGLA